MKKILFQTLLLFVTITSYASTITVCSSGCDHTTIAAAIAAASDCDVIDIQDAVHTEQGILVNKSLTIQGQGMTATIVQAHATKGSATDRVFSVNPHISVTFKNMTIRHGYVAGTGTGGGMLLKLFSPMSIITMENIVLTDNESGRSGGGLRANGTTSSTPGTLFMKNCAVKNNISKWDGGGIRVDRVHATFNNVSFTGNQALGNWRGGGFSVFTNSSANKAILDFTNCTFYNNSAGQGGGFSAFQCEATLVNCTFNLNDAFNTVGGGVQLGFSATLTLINNIIYGNTAKTLGGDVYNTPNAASHENEFLNPQQNLVGDCVSGDAEVPCPSWAYSSNPSLGAPTTCNNLTYLAPGGGSDAIDNGSTAGSSCDICGSSRGSSPDLGSYETNPVPGPEIALSGNGNNINAGDKTTSATNDTDFGNISMGSPELHSFTIHNNGAGTLNINSISSDASEFVVSNVPASVSPNGGTATFDVTFSPSAVSTFLGKITIISDDCDESPFGFAVSGEGNNCQIDISNVSVTDESCIGAADGSVDITVTGANGAVTFDWDNDGTGDDDDPEDLINVTAGLYSVTVTDSEDCTVEEFPFVDTTPDTEKPTCTSCPNYSTAINTNANDCFATISFTPATFDDNCGVTVLEAKITDNGSGVTVVNWTSNPDGDFPIGDYEIKWRAKDAVGNKKTCKKGFSVRDDVAPDAQCHTFVNVVPVNGNASITVADVDNGSSDNCGVASISIDESNFSCTTGTTFPVILTVEDVNGNMSTCFSDVVLSSGNVFWKEDIPQNEGSGTGLTFFFFQIQRDNTDCFMTIDYETADGTATLADNDYVSGSGTVYFPSGGSTTMYAILRGTKDNTLESNEAFYVNIVNPAPGINVTDAQAIGTLVNDDASSLLGNTSQNNNFNQTNFELASFNACKDKQNIIYEGTIALNYQTEVNAFPPCIAVVHGDLTIKGKDIYDLSPLENLQAVTGKLTLDNTQVSELESMTNLHTAGNIEILNNAQIKDLSHLKYIKIWDYLNLGNNGFDYIEGFQNQEQGFQLSVFPNPVEDRLNITLKETFQNGELTLTNALGRVVKTTSIHAFRKAYQLDVSDLVQGLYWLKVKADGQKLSQKIMIK